MKSREYYDNGSIQIAKNGYNDYKIDKKFTINNGKTVIGYVSQVNNNPSGEQSFVITDHYE